MLKALETLKDNLLYEYDALNDVFEVHDTDELADRIQSEIDKFYFPRPLFEDGEPADFRDDFVDCFGDTRKINKIVYIEEIGYHVFDADGHGVLISYGECLRRPPELDTQEKIDEDSTLTAREYCDKRGLNASYDSEMVVDHYPEIVMRRDLLARQRKLDGVE